MLKPKKKKLLNFLEGIVKIFYRKRQMIGQENIPDEPCILVGNHSQMHSPLATELFLRNKLIWCDGPMMNRKEIPEYTARVFWGNKPDRVKWFYKLLGCLMARPVAFLLENADTIGVYRDARLMTTFNDTVEALSQGINVVIFPENEFEFNEIVDNFNLKFVDVARLYYKATGKSVCFVPMYHAVALKKIVYGRPIRFEPSMNNVEQRTAVCDYLKEEITRIAKDLPRHKVVPFNNVSKKEYKYSKKN